MKLLSGTETMEEIGQLIKENTFLSTIKTTGLNQNKEQIIKNVNKLIKRKNLEKIKFDVHECNVKPCRRIYVALTKVKKVAPSDVCKLIAEMATPKCRCDEYRCQICGTKDMDNSVDCYYCSIEYCDGCAEEYLEAFQYCCQEQFDYSSESDSE